MKRNALTAIILIFIFILTSCLTYADGIVVAFEKREYSLLAGKTEMIKPVIQGSKNQGKSAFSSSDESIATVKNGQVKGISPGDVTISCTVTIGKEEYTCSYILHVLQPVTEISVPIKEMTLPSGAALRELPYKVLPDNAANKQIDIFRDGKKVSLNEDGSFPGSSVAMNSTYTFKATDGSNVTAKFKYIVPKVAWFSVQNNTVIDSPEGIDFFYIPTYEPGYMIFTVTSHADNKVIKCEGARNASSLIDEYLADKPYTLIAGNITEPSFLHVVPIKAGKGTYTVIVNGKKTTLSFTVTRSAIYETIKYEQYQKSEAKNRSLRFQVTGKVSAIDETTLYLYEGGDETKPVSVSIPESLKDQIPASGDTITVKGIFTGMNDYLTETGLTKSIPHFTAEYIE